MWDLEIFPWPPRAPREEHLPGHLFHLILPTQLSLLLLLLHRPCRLVDFRQKRESSWSSEGNGANVYGMWATRLSLDTTTCPIGAAAC